MVSRSDRNPTITNHMSAYIHARRKALGLSLGGLAERGRKEERAKTESDQGYIEDENGNKGWIIP